MSALQFTATVLTYLLTNGVQSLTASRALTKHLILTGSSIRVMSTHYAPPKRKTKIYIYIYTYNSTHTVVMLLEIIKRNATKNAQG